MVEWGISKFSGGLGGFACKRERETRKRQYIAAYIVCGLYEFFAF